MRTKTSALLKLSEGNSENISLKLSLLLNEFSMNY